MGKEAKPHIYVAGDNYPRKISKGTHKYMTTTMRHGSQHRLWRHKKSGDLVWEPV